MDAIKGPLPSKRVRLSEDQGFDIISNLQDEIIHHILSFASTKDAVRTCILSKRWLSLKTSSPAIVLADKPSVGVRVGLDTVNRTLDSHDSSDIRELRLVLSSRVNQSHLYSWILIAQTHNVRNLELILDVVHLYELPEWLYDCQRLVSLKLSMQVIMNTPSSTQLSNLRSLHLSKIIFSSSLSFHLIVTNCQVLEELALINCEWKDVGSLRVTIPRLRSLTIEQNFARGDILNGHIRFYAPDLSLFTCSSNLKVFFYLHQVASLERAVLDFDMLLAIPDGNLAPRAIQLLKSTRYVKQLTIATTSFYFFLYLQHRYRQSLQPYENLIYLDIKTKFYVTCTHLFLRCLLKMPNLEFLDLSEGLGKNLFFEGNLPDMIVPHSFHSSLKKIRITNFEGTREEMALVKFLLENATVLERMLIYFSDQLLLNPEKLIVISHHVEVLPRASDRLSIYYSDFLLMDMES